MLLFLLSCSGGAHGSDPEPHDSDSGASTDVPGVGSRNWTGEAHVVVGESWSGSETRTVVDVDGGVLCVETYDLTGTPTGECPDCTFAFRTVTSNVTTEEGDWCVELGLGNDPWSQETDPGLGFQESTGYMAYQDGRYSWSAVPGTSGTWVGDATEGDLTWDWHWMERDFYGYE